MKKLLLIAIVALSIISCDSKSDFDKGKQILESQGLTEIKNTGYNPWLGGQDDIYVTGFTAKDKNGNEVKGAFCSGLVLKGITIRYE